MKENKAVIENQKRKLNSIRFPKGELAYNTYKCTKCGYSWKLRSLTPTARCPECGGIAKPID